MLRGRGVLKKVGERQGNGKIDYSDERRIWVWTWVWGEGLYG